MTAGSKKLWQRCRGTDHHVPVCPGFLCHCQLVEEELVGNPPGWPLYHLVAAQDSAQGLGQVSGCRAAGYGSMILHPWRLLPGILSGHSVARGQSDPPADGFQPEKATSKSIISRLRKIRMTLKNNRLSAKEWGERSILALLFIAIGSLIYIVFSPLKPLLDPVPRRHGYTNHVGYFL